MTIKDIAKLANVSVSTVSKVINGKDQSINPQTRAKILQIAQEYHYTAYSSVIKSKQTRSFVIGILITDLSSCYEFVSGLIQTIQENNYSAILLEHKNDPETEKKLISSFSVTRIDGLFWEPASLDNQTYIDDVLQNSTACIRLDSFGIGDLFSIDYKKISYILTQNLINNGHREIACIAPQHSSAFKYFVEGFRKCLYDNHILMSKNEYIYDSDSKYIYRIVKSSCTAAVTFDYDIGSALYRSLESMHYQIPSQFSIASVKSKEYDLSIFPSISSICFSSKMYGSFCAGQLIGICNGASVPTEKELFLPELKLDTPISISYPSVSSSGHFLVVGSINADTTFLVPALPQAGKTVEILTTHHGVGGKGANQAIGLARLKKNVALIGNIGNDEEASFIYHFLESEHVNTQGVHRDKHSPTGSAYIYLETEGESAITLVSGANNKLTSELLERHEALFNDASFCLFSCEIPETTVKFGLKFAHEKGVKTILKPTTIHELTKETSQYIDIFIPNRKEALALCSPNCQSIEEQAEYFYNLGIPTVIITLGHNGCYIKTASLSKHYPAADFECQDSTGGADAFISALAAFLGEGYDIEKSIQIATLAAGFCVSRQGVEAALIDRFTLENCLYDKGISLE